jgi:hypothetical protein
MVECSCAQEVTAKVRNAWRLGEGRAGGTVRGLGTVATARATSQGLVSSTKYYMLLQQPSIEEVAVPSFSGSGHGSSAAGRFQGAVSPEPAVPPRQSVSVA